MAANIKQTEPVRTQTATLRYLHIAPRKVRSVADTLRGLSLNEAAAQLVLRASRSAKPLLKLLRSATANAKVKHMDPSRLAVTHIHVDPGPMLKRFLPRAQGRATPIHKKMSHITLVLGEIETPRAARFLMTPPPKKEKKGKKKEGAAAAKPRTMEAKDEKKQEAVKKEPGFFRRIFRRKSV